VDKPPVPPILLEALSRPAQAELLSAVVKGPCFKADELPPVLDAARKPPSRPTGKQLFDEDQDEDA